MKKIAALILALCLSIAAFSALAEDEIGFYTDEHPEAMAYVSTWVAEDGYWRIEVYDEDSGLKLMIVHTLGDNKEDIWVSRVPVPVTGKVEQHVHEDFSACTPRSFVPGWNVYSPCWCPVSLENVREADGRSFHALRMKCADP